MKRGGNCRFKNMTWQILYIFHNRLGVFILLVQQRQSGVFQKWMTLSLWLNGLCQCVCLWHSSFCCLQSLGVKTPRENAYCWLQTDALFSYCCEPWCLKEVHELLYEYNHFWFHIFWSSVFSYLVQIVIMVKKWKCHFPA